ncbi:MAG: hypothetical protein FWE37_03495 [Spirochaetaceae bacterium]|nr:hypothetical protein [Spirochaetaceae bacterium]
MFGNVKYKDSLFSEAIKKAIHYCQSHDILKKFFKEHALEVTGMLMKEWTQEEMEAAIKEVDREEGLLEGGGKGMLEGKLEIARNALANGLALEGIAAIIGLNLDEIKALS